MLNFLSLEVMLVSIERAYKIISFFLDFALAELENNYDTATTERPQHYKSYDAKRRTKLPFLPTMEDHLESPFMKAPTSQSAR